MSVYNVTLTDETPAAELRGHWVPSGSEWKWQDGPAMTAFRTGGILVLNEIDKASADCLDFCHALLDDPGVSAMTLPNGETAFPHSDFRVVATMNATPRDLPEAIADRFAVAVEIVEPHPDAIASLPMDLQEVARNLAGKDTDPDRPGTLRRWKAYAAMRDVVSADDAAAAVFAHRASEVANMLTLADSR